MAGSFVNGHNTLMASDSGKRSFTRRERDLDPWRGARRRHGRSSSRSRTRDSQADKQIDNVLDYMRADWDFIVGDDCIPVTTALQFLDESSLGLAHRSEEFQSAHEQLQDTLRAIVNEHYQGFNSSIGTYHQLNAGISMAQERIRELRQALVDSKTYLTATKAEFSHAYKTSRDLEFQLDVLNAIEQAQAVPGVLESRISEKRFLAAVEALQEGQRLVTGPLLAKVEALADMRVYMSNQESSLAEILYEELHSQLYLKSPYCESRWSAYAKLYTTRDELNFVNSLDRDLFNFLELLQTKDAAPDESSRNPEADSFHYIWIIVEALKRLDRLEELIDVLDHRLPVELLRVQERSILEIQQRHPKAARFHLKGDQRLVLQLEDDERETILRDLLGTLFARFEAIAEFYSVLHEVFRVICAHDSKYDSARLSSAFKELWKLYQSEMRALLHDYLSSDELTSRIGHVTEDNIFRQQRDKSKKTTFKLEWIDHGDPSLQAERDELGAIWQKQVPGITSLPHYSNKAQGAETNAVEAAGKTVLIKPSVFNITYMLPPAVMFLRRLKEVVPPTSGVPIGTLGSFLNDFLINVFHPLLEETLTDLCAESYLQPDALQQDTHWAQSSTRPILKGSVKFSDTISAFCRMLADLTHDQLFSQLVISQLNTYYDKCCNWFKALVARSQSRPGDRTTKAAAAFAQSGAICDAVIKVAQRDDLGGGDLMEETLLIQQAVATEVDDSDSLIDRKTATSLCLMYTSMKWVATRIRALRYLSPKATDQTGMQDDDDQKPQLKRSLTTALIEDREGLHGREILPLSAHTAVLFDSIVDGFEELANTILRTLHLEIRCNIAYRLSNNFRGSLLLPDTFNSPNENMGKLLGDVVTYNQELRKHLLEIEYGFVTAGLIPFVDAVFLKAAEGIDRVNHSGAAYMLLNARVLRHGLLPLTLPLPIEQAAGHLRSTVDMIEDASQSGFSRSENFYAALAAGLKSPNPGNGHSSASLPAGLTLAEKTNLTRLLNFSTP